MSNQLIDINKHPLIKQAYEVCQAIEKCGASVELTDAVTKASALMQGIANAVSLLEELDKWQQESSTWQSVAEKQLAIAIEAEKRIAEQHQLLQWAHDTLVEINPNNYTHDDVCEINNASVEVILGIAPTLGETHGKSEDWWASRAAGITAKGE